MQHLVGILMDERITFHAEPELEKDCTAGECRMPAMKVWLKWIPALWWLQRWCTAGRGPKRRANTPLLPSRERMLHTRR